MRVRINIHGNAKRCLQDLARNAGKPISEAATASARRISVNLAFHTEPFGFGDDARMKGEEAIRGDIRKVYAIASDVFSELLGINPAQARAFYRYMKEENYARASGILYDVGSVYARLPIDDVVPSFHQGSRSDGGRVQVSDPLELVKKVELLQSYIYKIQKRSGYAASGWSECASQLGGTRGIPNWKKGNHGLPYETGEVKNNSAMGAKGFGRIIITNLVPYASEACPERNQERALERERVIMKDMLDRALDAAARDAGFE